MDRQYFDIDKLIKSDAEIVGEVSARRARDTDATISLPLDEFGYPIELGSLVVDSHGEYMIVLALEFRLGGEVYFHVKPLGWGKSVFTSNDKFTVVAIMEVEK